MTRRKSDIGKSEGRAFKVLEFIAELIGWMQIVASPLFIGVAIGAIIYFPNPSQTRLVFGVILATCGLVLGVIWATKKWKGKGTIYFLSRIMATPEMDKPQDEVQISTKINDEQNASH